MTEPVDGTKLRTVFVVYGRNRAARDSMFAFLRALDLQPLEWDAMRDATGEASPYVGDILDAGFRRAQAAVVLFTPDDIAHLRADYADGPADDAANPADQARPNVLFEAGMAVGRYSSRTVLVELGRLRGISDLAGRHVVRMNNSPERRNDLARRLVTAGLAANMDGSDWLSAGDFTPPSASVVSSVRRDAPTAEPAEQVRTSSGGSSVGAVRDGSLTLTPGRRSRSRFGAGTEINIRVDNDMDGSHVSALVIRATFLLNDEVVGSALGTLNDVAPGATKYTDLSSDDDIDDAAAVNLQIDVRL